jgi:hypothetical protein
MYCERLHSTGGTTGACTLASCWSAPSNNLQAAGKKRTQGIRLSLPSVQSSMTRQRCPQLLAQSIPATLTTWNGYAAGLELSCAWGTLCCLPVSIDLVHLDMQLVELGHTLGLTTSDLLDSCLAAFDVNHMYVLDPCVSPSGFLCM